MGGQLREILAYGQGQEVLALLARGAGVQGLAMQPGTQDAGDVEGLGAAFGKGLMDLLNAHDRRSRRTSEAGERCCAAWPAAGRRPWRRQRPASRDGPRSP